MHFIYRRGDWILGSAIVLVLVVCLGLVVWDQMPPPEVRQGAQQPQVQREPPALPEGVAVSPDLTPEQVVRTVIGAMAQNDEPAPDTGIAVAFAFASPSNKQKTGPFARFAAMVKSPAYRPMLNHASAEYGPMLRVGDQARQAVQLTQPDGLTAAYLFILSQQADGAQKDCWMTEGVLLLDKSQQSPAATARDDLI